MKQRLLFFSLVGSVLTLASCQRTPYTAFQKPTTPVIERTEPTNLPTTSAQAHEGGISAPVVVISPAKAHAAVEAMPLETSDRTVTWGKTTAETTKKAIVPKSAAPASKLLTRMVSKRIEKIRANKAVLAQGQDRSGDTLALLSLVFGAGGLLLGLLGIGGGIGFLFGIVGLVLGLIGLKRTSQRTMAILGIVFGGVVVLLYIIAIALLASGGFF